MSPERVAVPGLVLLITGALFASIGMAGAFVAVPLGVGLALVLVAGHEALVALGSRE